MGRLPDQALKVSMPGIPGNAAAVAVKCGGGSVGQNELQHAT